MEGSHQQNIARSLAETLDPSNICQGLEKGTKKKRNEFWQHSKLFGVVKTEAKHEDMQKDVLKQWRDAKMTDEFQDRKM